MTKEKNINLKLTLGQINNILNNPGFNSFLDKELPIKVSFKLARLRVLMQNELNEFYKQRDILLNKYTEKDSDGKPVFVDQNNIKITEDNKPIFINKMNELLSVECNFPGIPKIEISADSVPTINGKEAIAMMDIIELI